MSEEFEEYATFMVTTRDGSEAELAVVDEFDFEGKHYIVGARIIGDTIDDTGRYIYEYVAEGDDFRAEKIRRDFDYRRIAQAYMEMSEEE